ncbi:MAG: CBS domain-containing protein [Longimicrobiales bacterium]
MRIRDILQTKGGHVFSITPDRTVHDAMRAMMDREIGCLVVMDRDHIEGIITERDLLKFATRRTHAIDTITVDDIMTRNVIVGVADDRVDSVMELMTRNRIRHLPVVKDRRLVGLVSIGDLVNAVRTDMEMENRYLHDYIAGVVA